MTGFQLVGYYVEKPEVVENSTSRKHSKIKVKTKPNFKKSFDDNSFDTFEVYLWRGMSLEFIESIPLNTTVSITGRLEKMDNDLVLIGEFVETLDCMRKNCLEPR